MGRLHRFGEKQLRETTFRVQGALGEMSINEDDFNATERKQFNQLRTLANLERHDVEDHERELRILRTGTRPLLIHMFEMQTAPRQRVWRSKRLAKAGRRGKERERPRLLSGCCFVEASISLRYHAWDTSKFKSGDWGETAWLFAVPASLCHSLGTFNTPGTG